MNVAGARAMVAPFVNGLFPEPPAPRSRPRERLWAVGTGLAVAVITLLRAPFIFDRFWAEDGSVFYQDALTNGPTAGFGHWYAGYLHTIPRIIASIAAAFPVRDAAAVFATLVLLTLATGAALVESRSGAYIVRRWLRVGVALSIALVPIIGEEAIGNVANLQFFLAFFAFWMLLWFPRHWVTIAASAVLLALISMSTLIIVFIVPVALARLLVRGRRGTWLPTLGLLTGLAVQVVGRRIVHPGRGIGGAPLADAIVWFKVSVVGNLRPGAPMSEFVDPSASNYSPGPVLVAVWIIVLTAVIVVIGTVFVGRRHRTAASPERVAPDAAAPRMLVAVVLILSVLSGFGMAMAAGPVPRYSVLPALFLMTALGVACDRTLEVHRGWVGRVPVAIVVAAMLAAAFTGRAPDSVRDQPALSWSAGVDDARARCLARRTATDANPDAAGDGNTETIGSSPRTWTVIVTCHDLVR